jgi:hypothetical protein
MVSDLLPAHPHRTLRTKPRKAGEFKRQGKKVGAHEHSSRKEWETLQLDKSFAERFAAE